MTLPGASNAAKADTGLDGSKVDSALDQLVAEPEIWILRPLLSGASDPFEQLSRWQRAGYWALRDLPVRRHIGYAGVDDDNRAFSWFTVNEIRCLGGENLSNQLRSVEKVVHRPSAIGVSIDKRTRRLAHGLADATACERISARLAMRLTRVAGHAIRAVERFVDHNAPTCIVVATQHSFQARAMSWVARERGIPTVYVPHAPVSMKRQYADLPFDYAALRGSQAIEYYAGLGADRARMCAVGDLSLGDIPDSPLVPARDKVVVAPSPWPEEKVRTFMDIVSNGVDGRYQVYPHPRSDLDQLRNATGTTGTLVTGHRTATALGQGATVVIQHGSGVSLEAMLLGIPVIEVLMERSHPRSPVTREPHAYVVGDARELRHCLQTIAAGEPDSRRIDRQDWAREWCSATGAESQRRFDELLQSDLRADGPLVDGWSTPNIFPGRAQ